MFDLTCCFIHLSTFLLRHAITDCAATRRQKSDSPTYTMKSRWVLGSNKWRNMLNFLHRVGTHCTAMNRQRLKLSYISQIITGTRITQCRSFTATGHGGGMRGKERREERMESTETRIVKEIERESGKRRTRWKMRFEMCSQLISMLTTSDS